MAKDVFGISIKAGTSLPAATWIIRQWTVMTRLVDRWCNVNYSRLMECGLHRHIKPQGATTSPEVSYRRHCLRLIRLIICTTQPVAYAVSAALSAMELRVPMRPISITTRPAVSGRSGSVRRLLSIIRSITTGAASFSTSDSAPYPGSQTSGTGIAAR